MLLSSGITSNETVSDGTAPKPVPGLDPQNATARKEPDGNLTLPRDIFRFPEEAFDVMRALEAAGHEAYFVGGCVRDSIMCRPVSDVDIATSARWEETAAACEACGMRAHETGVKHGTVTIVVKGEEGPQAFEVTTYRVDSKTSSDSRHPDSVRFVSSIDEDLARRDFTMNAMAWHPECGLVDPYGGRRDIAAGVIRVVGDPNQRFREDALRILRACRFDSQLGFRIDGATYEAMLSHKSFLGNVSTERITHELDLLLLGEHVHDALMHTVDVLSFVLPELAAMKNCRQPTKYHCFDVLEHTAWAVQNAAPERLVRWAALCHDMGKPACMFFDGDGVVHFYGHAAVSAKLARGMMDRLLMSPAFKDDLCAMVLNHSDKVASTPRSVKRALGKVSGDVDLFRSLLALKRADILAHAPEYRGQAACMDEIEATLDELLAKGEAFAIRHLAIDGRDVMAFGVTKGPEVGRVLQAALDAVVNEAVANEREALLEYVEGVVADIAEGIVTSHAGSQSN